MPITKVQNELGTMETKSVVYRENSEPWWLAGGISPAQVAAVYQPRWARNEAAAVLDLSGNGKHLLKIGSPSWSAQNGWTIPAGGNHGYDASVDYVSAIVRWSGRTLNGSASLLCKYFGKSLAAGLKVGMVSGDASYYDRAVMGLQSKYRVKTANHNAQSGVYSANFNQQLLWIDGIQVSTTEPLPKDIYGWNGPKLIGQINMVEWCTSLVNILAVAFYNIELTALQHNLLYQAIMNV